MNDFLDKRITFYLAVGMDQQEAEKDATADWSDRQNKETVNHPAHYNQIEEIECIDVAENFNFNLGAVIKHIWRAGLKGEALEDLRKAQWYLSREIERRSK